MHCFIDIKALRVDKIMGWRGGDDIQERATDQTWTPGHCSEDRTSVWGMHALLVELPGCPQVKWVVSLISSGPGISSRPGSLFIFTPAWTTILEGSAGHVSGARASLGPLVRSGCTSNLDIQIDGGSAISVEISLSSTGANELILRTSSWWLSDLSEYREEHVIPGGAGERGLILHSVESTGDMVQTAFINPTDTVLSLWEGMLKRGIWGCTRKPCRTLGTTWITASRGDSVLALGTSLCFSLRFYTYVCALLSTLGCL